MHTMVLKRLRAPLEPDERDLPVPGPGQVRLRVQACAVCRTDLHVIDGELPDIPLPIVPGHEIVGRVDACGPGVELESGSRLGVPWLGWTCGSCSYCRSGQENLCDRARFTGYTLDGGYAEYVVADYRYCLALPHEFDDSHAAPLLCAGLIGYRALRMAGDARRLGIYGIGAAAHIILQVAGFERRETYAFTRPGDDTAQAFARSVGAVWAGGSDERAPCELDAAIIFAPVGGLVPAALAAVRKGGTVVCGGIHMSDIPRFPYSVLWGERRLVSVANLTRRDATEFLALAPTVPIRTQIECFPLQEANEALDRLRRGSITGAAVLLMSR